MFHERLSLTIMVNRQDAYFKVFRGLGFEMECDQVLMADRPMW